jgi:hypothetical protein
VARPAATAATCSYSDQYHFDYGSEHAAAAHLLDRPTEQRGPADQYGNRNDAALAARDVAAVFAVELAVEEGDRTAGKDDRMRHIAKDRRHFAEQRVDDETGNEEQQRLGRCRRHRSRAGIGR